MNLELSEEQQLMIDSAKNFLQDSCPLDKVREWESLPEGYPSHIWKKTVDLGWPGIIYPEEYGGLEMSNLDATMLMREMGRVALSTPFLSTVLLAGRAVLESGNEEQKQEVLPSIIAGDMLLSFAFVEASARPNAATVKTTARAEEGGYVLNGTKHFVEFAEHADKMVVVARTSDSDDPEQGLTMFLLNAKAPGVEHETLSVLALQPQANVILNNVRVEASQVLGEVDQAWPIVYSVVQTATAILCGYMTGIGERAVDLGVNYSLERVQYEQPIGAFQAIQNYLSTAHTKVLIGEYLTYYAAWAIDNDLPSREAVSVAKAFVGGSCTEASQLATQLFGGMGSTVDAVTTPFLKWGKQLQQTLGNCQYHEKIIAEEVLDKEPKQMDEKYSVALTSS